MKRSTHSFTLHTYSTIPFFVRFVGQSFVPTFVRSFMCSFFRRFVVCLQNIISSCHEAVSSVSLHSIKQHLPVLSSFLFSVFYLSSWLQHTLYAFSSDTTDDLNKDKNCVVD